MDEIPKVSIIIINWNNYEDTIQCLESLRRINYSNFTIIIVDNGSKDESADKIERYLESRGLVSNYCSQEVIPRQYEKINVFSECKDANGHLNCMRAQEITLIRNEKNLGFAEGNNIGIRYGLNGSESKYFLLLNNDTLPDPDFLQELIKYAEKEPEIGFAGPKTYYCDFNNRSDVISFAGGKLDLKKGLPEHIGGDEVDCGQHDRLREVDYVEGSCLLVKKEVIEEIGLLDPSYFAYWEENDWCMRGKRNGYKVIYVPSARIWHKTSSSTSDSIKSYYNTRNRFLFLKRNVPFFYQISSLIYYFGFQFWWDILSHLKNNRIDSIVSQLKGVIDGIITLVIK